MRMRDGEWMNMRVFTLLAAILPLAAAQAAQPDWITDAATGCRVWDPSPAPNETFTWSGTCRDGTAQGHGVLQWFQDGKPASRDEGELRDGKLNGQGVLTLPGGDRYEGGFVDSRFGGRGIYTRANGDRYEGGFANDRFSGQGVLMRANGDRYEGGFAGGQFSGRGVRIWANGDRYEGEFRDGRQAGHGQFTVASSGKRQEGEWRDDQFVSTATAGLTHTIEIPVRKLNAGVFLLPATINNAMQLDFILDSGASTVTIPSDVAATLRGLGTITDADVIGKQNFQIADGSTVASTMFHIRLLKVGNVELQNVTASISGKGSPLLLGQSFLSRFKSWSVDNHRNVLVLE